MGATVEFNCSDFGPSGEHAQDADAAPAVQHREVPA
jgi:hypothetical protein